jgi:hypothetical protein
MASPRQAGKFPMLPPFVILAVLLAVPAGSLWAADGGKQAAVISDFHTGLALAGYDPVAYFADAKPVHGRADIEFTDARGVFRFRNEGNRDAYAANPEVYAPQFSGYDPLALARGIALDGNPLEWEIVGDRLYLFYSPQAHAAFKENPAQAIAAAAERWPGVAQGLTR